MRVILWLSVSFLFCSTLLMGQAPGLEPERLLRPPTIFDPAMSPDGKHIAYSAEHKGERVVIILDEEMNPFKLLTR